MRALLDALGNDLRELAAACAQLAADTTGVIDQAVVARYYRGRAEASGFTVADRAVEGRLADALELLRWALAVGVSPVLITSGLAQGVRLLGRVGSAPKGQPDAPLAAEVGAPPWKIDRVRQQLRGLDPGGHGPRPGRRGRGRRSGQRRGNEPWLRPGGGHPRHRGLPGPAQADWPE